MVEKKEKVLSSSEKKKKAFDNAWKFFSSYIKRRDKYVCITCGASANQTGHFIHGKTKEIYFDERNVHAQCKKCNYYLSGALDLYLRQLQLKYGVEKVDGLMAKRYKIKRWKIGELEEIFEKYRKKLTEGGEYKL